jgi:hypothetical protein
MCAADLRLRQGVICVLGRRQPTGPADERQSVAVVLVLQRNFGPPGPGVGRRGCLAGAMPDDFTCTSPDVPKDHGLYRPGCASPATRPPGHKSRCSIRLRKNKFADLAPGTQTLSAGSDLVDPIEASPAHPAPEALAPFWVSQNRSNGSIISRILRLWIGRGWPEGGMPKCEVNSARSLIPDHS